MNGGRGLLVAVLLCVAGATLGLSATGHAWAREESRVSAPAPGRPDAFVLTTTTRAADDVAPGARALALVSLAGAAATVGARGRGRQAIGVVVLATGIGSAALATRALTGPATGAVVAALVGGALVAAAGLLTVVTGASWPGLGSRYDAPATVPRDELGDAWDATDRGVDPTYDEPTDDGHPRPGAS